MARTAAATSHDNRYPAAEAAQIYGSVPLGIETDHCDDHGTGAESQTSARRARTRTRKRAKMHAGHLHDALSASLDAVAADTAALAADGGVDERSGEQTKVARVTNRVRPSMPVWQLAAAASVMILVSAIATYLLLRG